MVLSLQNNEHTVEGLKQGQQRQLFSYRRGLYGARQAFIGARQAIYSQWHHQGGGPGGASATLIQSLAHLLASPRKSSYRLEFGGDFFNSKC